MTRYLIIPPPGRIMVKIVRRGRETQLFEYFEILGAVSKEEFTRTKYDGFNYIAKDHMDRVRANKELLKKMKKLEVY